MAAEQPKKRKYNSMDLGAYQQSVDASIGPSPETLLSWRSDPNTNLSDWTIVVSSKEESSLDDEKDTEDKKADPSGKGKVLNIGDDKKRQNTSASLSDSKKTKAVTAPSTTTYHVHKSVLGLGPRGSRYFLNVFRSGKILAESQSSTSYLNLELSAAQAFPAMLDFMYSTNKEKVKASSETAVALRHLANYFEIPPLYESVNEFIRIDVSGNNIHIYLKEAMAYQDDKIFDATLNVAAKNWDTLFVNCEDKSKLKPKFLDMLPLEKQIELFHNSLIEAKASDMIQRSELNRFKRLTEEHSILKRSSAVPENVMPRLGDHNRFGRNIWDGGKPLFYYDMPED